MENFSEKLIKAGSAVRDIVTGFRRRSGWHRGVADVAWGHLLVKVPEAV